MNEIYPQLKGNGSASGKWPHQEEAHGGHKVCIPPSETKTNETKNRISKKCCHANQQQ